MGILSYLLCLDASKMREGTLKIFFDSWSIFCCIFYWLFVLYRRKTRKLQKIICKSSKVLIYVYLQQKQYTQINFNMAITNSYQITAILSANSLKQVEKKKTVLKMRIAKLSRDNQKLEAALEKMEFKRKSNYL